MNLTYPLILGSNSPRRKEILESAGFKFEVIARPVDEKFPSNLVGPEIPIWIANQKLKAFSDLNKSKIILCADTVVTNGKAVLGKASGRDQAVRMLTGLANGWHKVITGVAIAGPGFNTVFSVTTEVHFTPVSEYEIEFYVDNFSPFDKAGAYGIQEWIGSIAIDEIRGSYLNVVGLPMSKVYNMLKEFRA